MFTLTIEVSTSYSHHHVLGTCNVIIYMAKVNRVVVCSREQLANVILLCAFSVVTLHTTLLYLVQVSLHVHLVEQLSALVE